MRLISWYEEIAVLLDAQDEDWFASTLQAALQTLFHYDYYLEVMYQKNGGAQVRRSDFPNRSMALALRYYETETYIVDPIFRVFAAGQLDGGVYDLQELQENCGSLPKLDTSNLRHIIMDTSEDMGFRTIGWPKHLQETVIVVPVDDENLIVISLYNIGLEKKHRSDIAHLVKVYPVLSKIIAHHYRQHPYEAPDIVIDEGATPDFQAEAFSEADIIDFFKEAQETVISSKEAAVFTCLLQGLTAPATAEQLCLSVHTVKTHRRNVYRRIGHTRLLELISQFHTHKAKK